MIKKNKNILLVAGFVLGLLLCYQMAVSKTLGLKREYDRLKSEAALFENTPKQVSLLKQKQLYYDGLLSKYRLNGSSVQNGLLKAINVFSDSTGLRVIGFLEPHTVVQNDLKVSTYQFTLEGDFNAILGLIHKLEQGTRFGEIINLYFERKTNFRTGKSFLQARVLLKSFG